MPCGDCAKRREAIKQAWMRVRNLMTNGPKSAKQQAEELATEARMRHHEDIRQRQMQMTRLILPRQR